MATDLERLVVQMSADFKQFERQMARASGVTNRQFSAIERRAMQMNRNLDGIFARSFRGLAAPIAGVGAALGAGQLIELTNIWTDLTSRVNLAAGSHERGTEVMGRLGEMARRTYSSLEQTTESYLANATSLRELGYATDDQLDYTEALNNALVISAAKGQRAEAVQNALAKAMAGGKLQGENLNTVVEQGGRVAEALAKGLGVGVNQLRALGAAGKITSRDVFRALTSQMATLRKEAEAMPGTIADGAQLLRNALLEYVGNGDQATGVSRRIAEALEMMADNFDQTADVALQLAAVIAGALVGRSLAGMIAKLGLAGAALINFTRALSAARTMAGLATAFGGLSAAAGPVGLLIGGAVVASLALYSNATAEATAATRTYEDALEAVRAKAADVADTVGDAAAEIDDKALNILTQSAALAQSEVERLTAQIVQSLKEAADFFESYDIKLVSDEQLNDLRKLETGLGDGTIAAGEAEQALFALANANPRFQNLADRIAVITASLLEAISAADILNARLAGGTGPSARAAEDTSMADYAAMRAHSDAYISEAQRRAQLGKDQLALENEIARVRNDALKEGVTLTEQQIRSLAQANLAGNESRSAEGKKPKAERADEYARLAERISESTAALIGETEVQRQLNPLVNDYGFAVEKARAQQELLNAALKAGKTDTPALRAEIEGLANQYALATVEAAQLAEAHEDIRRAAEEAAQFNKDLLRGMVDGLLEGKKAADIFADALKKVGSRLLDMAFNSAFDMKGGGGGWLQTLIGGFFKREHGGPVKKGQPYIVGEKRAELFVPNQSGTILPRVPQMPSGLRASQSAGPQVTYAPNIDMRGASVEAVARLEGVLARDKAEFEMRVVRTVRRAQQSRAL